MLIDFCHHSVGSSIKTDKVCFDGYEVNNLVSSSPKLKHTGFISDHFVKPPINITVQFPCSISVYQVIINPAIGQQQSLDIKLFTASKHLTDTWLFGGNNDTVNTEGVMFNQIGYVSQVSPTLICVQNRRFNQRRLQNRDVVEKQMVTGELRSHKQWALTNVSHLNICVLRTKSGSSAAIKRLEIWGMPSSTLPSKLQEKLRKRYSESVFPDLRPDNVINGNSDSPENKHESTITTESSSTEKFAVPDDFTDEITCEIMACPVVLPSGKVIDQSTLDKFVNTEASWGRPPSDPFTGLEFTQGRQPLPNIALKSRIDDFTFKHADVLTVAKTLGRTGKFNTGSVKSSRLVHLHKFNEVKQPGTSSLSAINQTTTGSFCENNDSSLILQGNSRKRSFHKLDTESTSSKRGKLASETRTKEKLSNNRSMLSSNTVQSVNNASFISSTSPLPTTKMCDHRSDLNQSLDSALKDALGGLPSFTNTNGQVSITSKKGQAGEGLEDSVENIGIDSVCNKCKMDCRKADVIKYKLSCGHLICRNCVNKQDKLNMFCDVCNASYSRNELVRVF